MNEHSESRRTSPLNDEGSIDIDLMDLGSLSLTDNLYPDDQWSSDTYDVSSGTFEAGGMSHVTTHQDDVRGCDAIFNIVMQRPSDVSQTDNKTVNEVTNSLSMLTSMDEGYNSKSLSSNDRLSVQETDNNNFETSTTSLDVINVFSRDVDGDTDLHIGIIQKETSHIHTFINMAPGSEWLNICNHLLQTPLHLAVITQQLNIVRRLMTAGARVDVRDIHGNTPLHIACLNGCVEIVQCLLRPVYYEETLLNKYDIAYQRIPQDLNTRNCDGHTCLHLAAKCTNLRILEILLNAGADINIGDGTSGRTILHHAAETGNRILLNFLLSRRRLDVRCETYGGLTPLRLAAGRGYDDVVRILLVHGADVNDIDDSDNSDDENFESFPACRKIICT